MKIRSISPCVMFAGLLLIPSTGSAQKQEHRPLVVIKDYGNTRPSGIPDMQEIRALAKKMKVNESEILKRPPYSFPITSDAMKVGNLGAPILHEKSGITPFFIIGADVYSQDWLARNKAYLIEHGIGQGLITNIQDASTFKSFVDAAQPLRLHPLNVDDVAKVFGVFVYPLVITHTEILQ